MKQFLLIIIIAFNSVYASAQNNAIDKAKVQEDLNDLIENISNFYVYADDKAVNFECLQHRYSAKIEELQHPSEVILLFEYLLNEFYDSHISLNTNIRESYRLYAPLHVQLEKGKVIIKNVWQTQIANLEDNILGAEILQFNAVDFDQKIEEFPVLCNDKTLPEIRNWIANRILAGKYSEPRILSLKLKNGKRIQLDVDSLQFIPTSGLLSTQIKNDIGIIRINNSLGNNQLITAFDKALDQLSDTKGIILDLRNTNNGGNTYVAKGIMSRFINKEQPYQKHLYIESYDNQPKVVRSWLELVSPRGQQYTKPVIVLVGRWTGSMGEGLAIGFDALQRAQIVGTEMKRLAGSDVDFKFTHQNFGYKLILQKLYHVDGSPREQYVPKHYVTQSTLNKDETLEKGMLLMQVQLKKRDRDK